jgi:PKD repeat protein
MTIRPGTGSTNPSTGDIGEIYVSDVGWGTWEELNIVKEAGVNCGWPLYEGHTSLSNYYDLTTENMDEPNPLYGVGGCTQHYFTFKSLLKQSTADGITTVYNPCNASQPIGTGNRYFHRRPVIDCKHDQDIARVPIFSGNNAAVATIGTPASGVTGTPYRGNAAIAGCWYTGNLFPVNFRNTFLLADYGRTWVKAYTVNYTDVIQKVENFADGFLGIVSITENPLDGTIICVDNGNNIITRISYGGNQLPVVKMTANKTYGPSVLAVNFTGSTSYDPEGGSLTYLWKFGDNTTSTVANPPTHNFTAPANTPTKFVVKLTVTDNQGDASTDSIIISVNNTPPVVNITSPVKNSTYTLGLDTLYSCTATVTDAEHTPGQLKYTWQSILRHNNHQHPEPLDTNRITSTVISRIGCNGDTYYWLIKLTVTDAAGLSGSDSSKIFPPCANGSLPLVLRKFSVTQQGNENIVKWVTEMAMQIRNFEVERSTDGRNFFTINRQDAKNSMGINEYSFVDNSFPPGVNYYRLKMIEIGSMIRYSVLVKTGSQIKEGLDISPNPVVGNFSVRYNAIENGSVAIRISDISGREVATINENVNKGQNIIYIQNMPAWTAGMYVITVQQGSDIQQGKLIKAE